MSTSTCCLTTTRITGCTLLAGSTVGQPRSSTFARAVLRRPCHHRPTARLPRRRGYQPGHLEAEAVDGDPQSSGLDDRLVEMVPKNRAGVEIDLTAELTTGSPS